MLFKYTYLDKTGKEQEGTIEALDREVAISALQRRGLTILSIADANEVPFYQKRIKFFDRVSNKEIVIFSRQIATLFSAQVSALKIFRMLSESTKNKLLRDTLAEIADDLQGGSSVSRAMAKHDKIFSAFYVNMVRSGEETGKLDETFEYLADYLDRSYELTSKARNALIYPAFVMFTFVVVMVLMLTAVIPKISAILISSGQEIPVYTRIVIGISDFLVNYGIFFLIAAIIGGFFLVRYLRTEEGARQFATIKISIPFFGGLFRKLYLSRLADNMHTMLVSGIPMVQAIEVTSTVINNQRYKDILDEAVISIKGGKSVSDSLGVYDEIPQIMTQMIKVGEESGELGNILKTLADFYRREVTNTVDTLVDLIEPAMIVTLGLGVGFLLASVLIPIYNISSAV